MTTIIRVYSTLALLSATGCYSGLDASPAGAPGEDGTTNGGEGAEASASSSDSGSGDDTGQGACEEDLGLTPLRRLTIEQYDNTVADLLGYPEPAASGFPADEKVGPFAANSITGVSDLHVRHFSSAAEKVAQWVVDNTAGVLPCDAAALAGTAAEDECAEAFIAQFGPRAYRRPLEAADLKSFRAVFEHGRSTGGFLDGVRLIVETALQSPHFLYYIEFGSGENDGETVPLNDYELATRLSYFLWNTMPDDELFDAAAAGELAGEAELDAQVERMLADPRSADAVESFHRQWLGLDALAQETKLDPLWTEAVREAALEETLAFARWAVLEDDGSFDTLMRSSTTFASDPTLLEIYGVTPPPGAAPGEPFALPEEHRAGVLTRVAWLGGHAHPDQPAPVKRGKFIFEDLLCGEVPPPPPDVNNAVPPADPDSTTRERIEQLTSAPQCAACHAIMNPLGFALSNYDTVGAWRETEGMHAIDAKVDVVGADFGGQLNGPSDLIDELVDSEMAMRCVARQWTRFALGRDLEDDDGCALDEVETAMVDSDGNIREVIAAIARSHAFRHRKAAPAE